MSDKPVKVSVHTDPLAERDLITTGLARAGSLHSGEVVTFTFAAEGVGAITLNCPHHVLPQIVAGLSSAGQLAEHDRRGRPSGTKLNDIIQPYDVQSNPRIGRTSDGTLMVGFVAQSGFPIGIAMAPDQAISLARRILSEVEKPPIQSNLQ